MAEHTRPSAVSNTDSGIRRSGDVTWEDAHTSSVRARRAPPRCPTTALRTRRPRAPPRRGRPTPRSAGTATSRTAVAHDAQPPPAPRATTSPTASNTSANAGLARSCPHRHEALQRGRGGTRRARFGRAPVRASRRSAARPAHALGPGPSTPPSSPAAPAPPVELRARAWAAPSGSLEPAGCPRVPPRSPAAARRRHTALRRRGRRRCLRPCRTVAHRLGDGHERATSVRDLHLVGGLPSGFALPPPRRRPPARLPARSRCRPPRPRLDERSIGSRYTPPSTTRTAPSPPCATAQFTGKPMDLRSANLKRVLPPSAP